MKHYNIPIFIPHLGCPFDCIFCNQKNTAHREPAPDPARVPIMVRQMVDTIPAQGPESEIEVAYFGGSFTALNPNLQARYLQVLQPFWQSGIISGIRISTRPDFIDHTLLEFLQQNGVKTIELGIQSLDDQVLQRSGRGYTAEKAIQACRLIKEHGLKLGIQLMVGLPGDSYERDIETAIATIDLQPDMIRIYPVLVVKDTALERLYRQGRYRPLELEEAVAVCARMLALFQQHKLEVIRMGLHPADEIREEGVIVAGPFHPAFGELVEQLLYRYQARKLMENYTGFSEKAQDLQLYSSCWDLSKLIGNKKANLLYLNQLGETVIRRIKVHPHLQRDELGIGSVSSGRLEMKLSRPEFLAIYCQ